MYSTRGGNRPTPASSAAEVLSPGHGSYLWFTQQYFLSLCFSSSFPIPRGSREAFGVRGTWIKILVLSYAETLAHELAFWAVVLIIGNFFSKPRNHRIIDSWRNKGLLRLSSRAPTFNRWGMLKPRLDHSPSLWALEPVLSLLRPAALFRNA